MSLKIISLNCWGGRVHPEFLEFLAIADFDVFCLQEVNHAPYGALGKIAHDTDEGRPPVHADLFSVIEKMMPGHTAIFRPFSEGFLHDAASTPERIRFGIAAFVRKTLPIIGEKTAFVHGTYRASGERTHPAPRNAHCVRLWRHDVGKAIVIAHMHGLWVPELGKVDTPERILQAQALRALVEDVRQVGDDIVICGDFNVLPESKTFEILASLGVEDLVVKSVITDTRTSLYKKQPRLADYMLVSGGVKVRSFNALAEPEVSDHRPLILEIE